MAMLCEKNLLSHCKYIDLILKFGYTGDVEKEVADLASTIQIRVEEELKAKSDELFKSLGTDTTTAIRMFLTQALAVNGFPFEIKRRNVNPYEALTEAELLEKLEKSREHAAQGMVKDADDVVVDGL